MVNKMVVMENMGYEICEVCGGNTLTPVRLPYGTIICGHCDRNTYGCYECAEFFDGSNRDTCYFCGSRQIYKVGDDEKIKTGLD